MNTFHSSCNSLAPSILAASSKDFGTASKKLRSRMTLKAFAANPRMMPKRLSRSPRSRMFRKKGIMPALNHSVKAMAMLKKVRPRRRLRERA
ncbi:hypothetical protein D3C72_2147450 [compost metagenome]